MSHIKKIFKLLVQSERKQAYILLCLMVVGTVLEIASIGLILPALTIMNQQTTSSSAVWLLHVLNFLGHPTQNELIVIGVSALLAIYLVKTLFLVFLTWKQNVFIFGVRSALSQRLFTGYLSQPWSFYLQHNSAQLINILTNETNQFGVYALQPTLTLITEILVLIAICLLLVIAEPLAAIVMVLMLGAALLLIYLITKNYFARWGMARQFHEGQRIQHVQQGLGGVKEIKLLGREKEFIKSYTYHNLQSSRIVQLQNTLQQLPRLWLEFLAITVLSISILVSLEQGKSLTNVLATLALFVAAAFRLIPSVTRIIGAMQSLRYADSVVNLLCKEITMDMHVRPTQSKSLVFKQDIIFDKIHFKYPNTTTETLKQVSLAIPKGGCIGFIGESGSGKSTIIDILLGLLTPSSGKVLVDGIDIQQNLPSWQSQIGYVPQTIFLTDDTLRRNVAFGVAECDIDDVAVNRAIQMAQLEDFVKTLADGLNTHVGERGVRLSGGQRQRIGIARALYHDPQVLVLDEATSALDTTTEEEVMFSVNRLIGEKTLIIVAHRLSTLSHCDRLYYLENGKILDEGSYNNIALKANSKNDSEDLERKFDA